MAFGFSTLMSHSFSQVAGDVDVTWSNSGFTINNHVNDKNEYSEEIKILSDGSFLLIAHTGAPNRDILIAKYSASGYLNPNFGTAGILIIDINGDTDRAFDAHELAGGQLLIAGSSGSDLVLIRLEADGSFDFSFGTNGIISYTYADGPIAPFQMEVLADNSILLGVRIHNGFEFSSGLLKFTQHGAVSASFGQNGLSVFSDPNFTYAPSSMKVLADQSIVMCGYKIYNDRYNGFIIKFTSNGNVDVNFGTNGLGTEIGESSVITQFEDLNVDNEGRLIVISSNSNMDGAIYRYLANGLIDNSYTANGKITFGPDVNLRKFVKTIDNHFLVVGDGFGSEDNQIFTFMFNNNGEPNCNYHCNGVFTSLPHTVSFINANMLGLMIDGSILIGGFFLGPNYPQRSIFLGKLLNTNQVLSVSDQVFTKTTLTVYPNPAVGSFNISTDNKTEVEHIELIGLDGRTVQAWSTEMDTYQLNTSVSNGTYIVRVLTNKGMVTKQLVVYN